MGSNAELVEQLRRGELRNQQAADTIEALEAALKPFAEEAKFAQHRLTGPGYLTHEHWRRVRELADE